MDRESIENLNVDFISGFRGRFKKGSGHVGKGAAILEL